MGRRITQEGLLDAVDADLGWRRLELAAVHTSLSRSKGPAAEMAARAAVALAYAHWEGYVVATSRLLLEYVGGLKLRYRELSDPYLAICLASKLGEAEASVRRIRRHLDVVVLLRQADHTAVFPAPERAIYAEGNLKSDKFDDIITRLSIDPARFELHYNWLDAELLQRRNHIAHGAHGYADPAFAREALTTVRHLLDQFRNATQNAAVSEVFRRA